VVSTVHIAQKPGKYTPAEHTEGRKVLDDKKIEKPDWKETDVPLVDKHFNVMVSPKRTEVVKQFGEQSDDRRVYVVNEVCVQAIGAGDMTITFFSQDPTVYGYEQVTIWEGRFRNYAKVTKSTRGWTTTIRFGQPRIQDPEGKDYQYRLCYDVMLPCHT